MNRKIIGTGTTGLVLLINLMIIPTAGAQIENFLTYTNTNYGFTIKYPVDWNVDDSNITNMGIIFVGPVGGTVQVSRNLASIANPGNDTLEHLIKNMMMYQRPQGFRVTEINTQTFLSGHPSVRVVGIQGPPEYKTDVEIMTNTIQLGAYVYTVKYLSHVETYPTYLPIAQKMIDSFQVINTP